MSENDRTDRAIAARLRELAAETRDRVEDHVIAQYWTEPAKMPDQFARGLLEAADRLDEAAETHDPRRSCAGCGTAGCEHTPGWTRDDIDGGLYCPACARLNNED